MTHLRDRDTFYYNNEIKNRILSICEYGASKGCKFMTFGEAYDLRKNRFETTNYSIDYAGKIHFKY